MAEVFRNKKQKSVGTSPTTIGTYSVPPATIATLIGLSVANITTGTIRASVSVYSSAVDYYLVKDVDIIPGQAHAIVGGDQKVVLETGESIRVVSDTASSVDVVMSVLELS